MTIMLWDLPLRLFHWLLVLAISAAYVTASWGGLWLSWHEKVGVIVLALWVFRIAWGFMGSTYARFVQFFPTPRRLKTYFSSTEHAPGHTPLGALSIFCLLMVIFLQASSGLFALEDDTDYHGPLYALVNSAMSARLTDLHARQFDVLLFLIGLHLTAIFYYQRVKKHTIVSPMIHGHMTLPEGANVSPLQGGNPFQLFFSLTLAVVIFWSIESSALLHILAPDQVHTPQSAGPPVW